MYGNITLDHNHYTAWSASMLFAENLIIKKKCQISPFLKL